MSARNLPGGDECLAANAVAGTPILRVAYAHAELDALLAGPDVLAVFGFGGQSPASHPDPRYVHVALEPLLAAAPFEVWRGSAPVESGRADGVRFAHDGSLLFGAIEIDEPDFVSCEPAESNIAVASAAIYAQLGSFLAGCDYPHALRIWNYLAAITEGSDDNERYRQFCIGRARGLSSQSSYPAATAIGIPASAGNGARRLQVYFLAAKSPGTPLENPRQVSAYLYPRQYGPQPPSFARAMLAPSMAASVAPLLVSGTASVRGHASVHADDLIAQIDETLLNLKSVLEAARDLEPGLPPGFGAHSVLKVYLRDQSQASLLVATLRDRLPAGTPLLVLHADVCRPELLIEIDGFHGV